MIIEPIAHIRNDFKEKFGIPRQSGLTSTLSDVVFEKKYSDENALRGLEDFSHIWLIWGFSEAGEGFSPTVRPPRLGGNVRKGVFATRSPFRPNKLALSAVRLESVRRGVITVSGADILDGSPVYDVKPYIPYADSIPDASNGWALSDKSPLLNVRIPDSLLSIIPEELRLPLTEVLSQDPRPQYQDNPQRVYTMAFAEFQVSFTVSGTELFITEIRHN